MPKPTSSPITQLLLAANEGDSTAHKRLWLAVYDELRSLAQRQMKDEAPGRTLQPTALVHEVYFRLFEGHDVQWSSRRHFFGAAAKAMRRIRVDDARKRNRLKRGGGQQRVAAPEAIAVFDQDPAEVLAIDEALEKLKQAHPRQAEVATLRYFVGLTVQETAATLNVSPRTVDGEWRLARAWLHRELSKGNTSTASLGS